MLMNVGFIIMLCNVQAIVYCKHCEGNEIPFITKHNINCFTNLALSKAGWKIFGQCSVRYRHAMVLCKDLLSFKKPFLNLIQLRHLFYKKII